MPFKKVLFRTDGNETTGLGHIVRCTALAEMIAPEFTSVFVVKNSSAAATKMISHAGFQFTVIDEELDFFQLLSSSAIAVTDGYSFDETYFQSIIQTGAKLVCIDDMVNTYYPAHLIINQNPACSADDYRAAPYTRFAIGLSFALLRKPFREALQLQKKAAKNGNYLIAMGGTDPLNLSKSVIDSLRLVVPDDRISLLISENKYATYKRLFPTIHHYHSLDASALCDLMLQHQYLICPASSVSIEGLCLGMELLCGYYVNNQERFYNYLHSKRYITGIGDLTNQENVNLIHSIIVNRHYTKLTYQLSLADMKSLFNSLTNERH